MKIQTDFNLTEFNYDLDLSEFYSQALERGFINNSSQQKMIDCFKQERHWNAWVLYKQGVACGSVACHSLDIMGANAYRLCARACFFYDYNIVKGLIIRRAAINQYQHPVAQLYMPASIEWAGEDKDFYITTNDSPEATQRSVHRFWCPEMTRMGVLEKVVDQEYRGHMQTFWKLKTQSFLKDLNNYPRWQLQST